MGATIKRARVFDEPVNEYQKFEIEGGYQFQYKVGVDFYFVSRKKFNALIEQNFELGFIVKDLWLFDDSFGVIFNYNENSEWTGYEIIEDTKTYLRYSKLKDLLTSGAYTYNFDRLRVLQSFGVLN